MAQDWDSNGPTSIYDKYGPGANLNARDKRAIAKYILGLDEGYSVVNFGTKTCPDFKVLQRESDGKLVHAKNTPKLLGLLRK